MAEQYITPWAYSEREQSSPCSLVVFGSLLAPPTALSGVEGNFKWCLYIPSWEHEELRERNGSFFSLSWESWSNKRQKGCGESSKTFSLVGSKGLWMLYIEDWCIPITQGGIRWTHFTSNGPCSDAAGLHSSNRAVNIYHKTRRRSIDCWVFASSFPFQMSSDLWQFPSCSPSQPPPLWGAMGQRKEISRQLYAYFQGELLQSFWKFPFPPSFPC